MPKPLTDRQQKVVGTIQAWIKEHGIPPTIRELRGPLGIKSLRGVTTHLDALAKKGVLMRKHGARGIRLLVDTAFQAVEHAIRVPIVGRVAAGTPLLAEEQIEGQLIVDESLLGKAPLSAKHFALRVHGESMVDAGILEGDFVIVREQPTATNGDIIVALLGDEATVKRFFQESDHIRLQPAHPTMEPIILTPQHSIAILGKVLAVFRSLAA